MAPATPLPSFVPESIFLMAEVILLLPWSITLLSLHEVRWDSLIQYLLGMTSQRMHIWGLIPSRLVLALVWCGIIHIVFFYSHTVLSHELMYFASGWLDPFIRQLLNAQHEHILSHLTSFQNFDNLHKKDKKILMCYLRTCLVEEYGTKLMLVMILIQIREAKTKKYKREVTTSMFHISFFFWICSAWKIIAGNF